MSILIRNMEMPNACVYRENGHLITCSLYDIDGYCGVLNKEASHKENNRPSWCPLIKVPPHGDLISREWLIDIALHLMNIAKNDDIADGVKWLWQYIIEAPTTIESEE